MSRALAAMSLVLAAAAAGLWAQEAPPPLSPPQVPSGPTPMPAVLRDYTPVTGDRLRSPRDGDWMMNRRTYDGWGYSPLAQVTPANVARLKPVWSMSTGAINGHEAAPIVHDGVMFVATPGSQVMAIEAATGTVLWRYRRPLGPAVINRHPTTRGLGLLGDKELGTAAGNRGWAGFRRRNLGPHVPRLRRANRQGAVGVPHQLASFRKCRRAVRCGCSHWLTDIRMPRSRQLAGPFHRQAIALSSFPWGSTHRHRLRSGST